MSCGSSNAGSALQAQQQAQQALTQKSVNNINQAFAGFTPQTYQNVSTAYNQWALPQLGQQYRQNERALSFNLADRGLLNSSAAQTERNALSANLAQSQNQIGNQATTAANNFQQQVAQEKANLIGQAQTASDPSAIAQQALATAAGTSAPSTFAPLGQLFNNFATQYLGNQNSNLANQFFNQYLNAFSNPSVFGSQNYGLGSLT